MTRSRRRLYRRTGPVMLRAAVNFTAPTLPAWPETGASTGRWADWLKPVWADENFRQTVTAASPDLARQVETIIAGRAVKARRARRAALALARYAIRYARRSTPFGLFAGVALARFGEEGAFVRIGDAHEVVHRADPRLVEERVRPRGGAVADSARRPGRRDGGRAAGPAARRTGG